MLTFRAGAASTSSGAAGKMADHLMNMTLPNFEQDMAAYYQRGMTVDGGLWQPGTAAAENNAAATVTDAARPGTVPEPRRDMYAAVAAKLGIDTSRLLTRDEIAELLAGNRADGEKIEGKQYQRAVAPLAEVFGLDPMRLPTREELENLLAGRRADGTDLPAPAAGSTAKAAPTAPGTVPEAVTARLSGENQPSPHPDLVRLYKALGAKDGRGLSETERANILEGRRADGKALDTAEWREAVNRSKTPIGYVDFTFSADKTVSLAWAFAPTEAERNQLAQAHKDAVAATVAEIEQVIGQARKGRGGQEGTEQGRIGWITFDHYTARPTLEIARQTADGRTETEIVSVKVAGDPQLHTHVAVPNMIATDSGRVVSLNTLTMHGRIHEWGAIYQAHLAQNLRRMGARVELDRTNGAARLSAVPEEIRAAFSKRTRDALADAKAYAASAGADWERMSGDERIKLLKGGAFASRTAKADDLSDFASWRRQAEARGYQHKSVLRSDAPARPMAEAARLDLAYDTAAGVLGEHFERRAVISGEDERVAAARGLIAAGIKDGGDVD